MALLYILKQTYQKMFLSFSETDMSENVFYHSLKQTGRGQRG